MAAVAALRAKIDHSTMALPAEIHGNMATGSRRDSGAIRTGALIWTPLEIRIRISNF